MKPTLKKIVLAYSGGLYTSVILKWLQEEYQAQVIAYVANIWQGEELEEKAYQMGASKVYVEDLQEEFITQYIFPSLQSHAVYECEYLLGTALARPLIEKKQIEIAHIEQAEAVAHGSTGKGNNQIRFDLAYKALDPNITIIAPWREWNLQSLEALINYAQKHTISVPSAAKNPIPATATSCT